MENLKKLLLLFIAAVLGGLISLGAYRLFDKREATATNNLNVRGAGYEFKNITIPTFDFAEVSGAVTPTVVHIKVKIDAPQEQQGRRQQSPFEFFDDMFPQVPRGPQEGAGSGVIISDQGYIVTNNHVVGDASEIEVTLHDKRAFKADVIGKDPNTDLALIKINAENLTPVKVGNSDALRVGEWVLAVGNPFNLTSTVTAGIVSAKARSIHLLGGNTAIESFIQTDAAVNPGNSGGALINSKGELVGINTAIASNTGTFSGYSFAVPANIMNKVVKDFMEFGEVQRGFIGVQIRDVDSKLAQEKELGSTKGVYVEDLTENGAAETAGIKKGDVILKIDGLEVNSVPALQEMVGAHRPGDEIKVNIIRGGKEKEVAVILRNKEGKVGTVTSATKELRKMLGAEFEIITDAEKNKLKIGNGVKVKSLEKGALKDAGVPQGFIITSVDRQGVYSSNDVFRGLNGKKGGIMIEGYLPSGDHKYYVIEVPAK